MYPTISMELNEVVKVNLGQQQFRYSPSVACEPIWKIAGNACLFLNEIPD